MTLFGPFTHPILGGGDGLLDRRLTNAFNMLDNMDGLAASVGLIAAALFCGAQVAVGSLFAPAVLLVVVGALAGFLVHNHCPARLYMGDAGSNFLGFLLGALTVVGTFTAMSAGAYSPYGVLAPLLVMAVPLYDMTSVIVIRLREGRSPFLGDRRHFSHRLVARGLTPPQAVWTIDLVTLAGGLGALFLHRLDGLGRAWSWLRPAACWESWPFSNSRRAVRSKPMARRGAKPSVPLPPRPSQQSDAKSRQARSAASLDDTDREQEAAEMAERVRRIALGLTAALVTARAFWPSEPDLEEGAGGGLYWLFVVFIAFGLALTSALVGGRVRFRWSWTDAAVVGLMALVAASAFHALDRRPAINLAWEWVGLGMIYLLVRNLPRTQAESAALAGVLVATAFAVSVYGLYQLTIELPLIRGQYLRNPQAILQRLGIEPSTTAKCCSGTACSRPRSGRHLPWPIRWLVICGSARRRCGGCFSGLGAPG